MRIGKHLSHVTRFSDASTFDEICTSCGATDEVPGGWGALALPCPGKSETLSTSRPGTLTRYRESYNDCDPPDFDGVVPDKSGDWCKASDVDALEVRLRALEAVELQMQLWLIDNKGHYHEDDIEDVIATWLASLKEDPNE